MSGTSTLLVVARDFGTAYSGYAYSFKSKLTEIKTNQGWSNSLRYFKTPTVILVDQDRKFSALGYEAEEKYAQLLEDDEAEGWALFRRFKMQLYKNPDLSEGLEITDLSGKVKIPANSAFFMVIRYLKLLLPMLSVKRRLKVVKNESDSHFVLAAPAIWNDTARHFKREAAADAGIPNDRFSLALESEAASVWCQNIQIKSNSKYMVVDMGGPGQYDLIEATPRVLMKRIHIDKVHGNSGTEEKIRQVLSQWFWKREQIDEVNENSDSMKRLLETSMNSFKDSMKRLLETSMNSFKDISFQERYIHRIEYIPDETDEETHEKEKKRQYSKYGQNGLEAIPIDSLKRCEQVIVDVLGRSAIGKLRFFNAIRAKTEVHYMAEINKENGETDIDITNHERLKKGRPAQWEKIRCLLEERKKENRSLIQELHPLVRQYEVVYPLSRLRLICLSRGFNTVFGEQLEKDRRSDFFKDCKISPSDLREQCEIEIHRREEREKGRQNLCLGHKRSCKICYGEEACVVFLPCSHMIACENCSSRLQNCAMCRSLIKGSFVVELNISI